MTSLEAATSRLEDIATSTELPKDVPALNQAVASPAGTEEVARKPTQTPKPPTPEKVPETVEDFDQLIGSSVTKYVKLSDELGGAVARQVRNILGNRLCKEQQADSVKNTTGTKSLTWLPRAADVSFNNNEIG